MWPFDIRHKRATKLIKSMSGTLPHTPDKALLVQSEYRLVFACDDMMRAHKNYSLIKEHSAKVSRGFTQHPFDYRIAKHTGRGLPFMTPRTGLKIKGEIHAVLSERIPELDNHYRNGVEFARCRVPILVVDREHHLMDIGSEAFVKELAPGIIRTVPELNIRHYLSHQFVCIISADMYIPIKKHWVDQPKEGLSYPNVPVEFPKDPALWLPQYYKYPINRNR